MYASVSENRGRSKICAFCNADQTTRARKQKDPGPKKPAPQTKDTPKGCLIAIAFVVAALGTRVISVAELRGLRSGR